MEKMFFSEPQQRVTVGAYGKVLVLLNERKEKPVGDNMGDDMREAVPTEQYVYDGCLLDTGGMASEQALLAAAKREVLSAISTYDASDSVNTLVVNGQRGWLDKATRVGLMNGVGVAKACGLERMSLWIDGREYVMDVERLEELLVKVEVYAMGCYNVTAGHRRAVDGLKTLEAVLGYDFKAGYPEKVSMEL